MKVAITGGTGFVGVMLARELLEHGHEVVLISRGVRVPEGIETHREGGRCRLMPTGLDNQDSLTEAFRGCGAIAHLAGINREVGPQTYQRVHVDGTRNVVGAAAAAGVPHITCLSFLRARPDCGSKYHQSKWEAEEIVRSSGIAHTIVKAGVIYGRGDHMVTHLSQSLHTGPLFGLVGFNDTFLSPVAGEDVAKILASAAVERTLDNKTISVIGPERMTLREAVARVGETIGVRPVFIKLPVFFHYVLAQCFELVMNVPLIAKAQVRILSEDLTEALPEAELPPDGLQPSRRFVPEQIRAALPDRKRFGAEDFRFCCSH